MKNQTEKNTSNIKGLLSPSLRQDIFHPSRLLYAILFGALFVTLGYFGPRFYLENFDTTEYYSVEQPVTVHKHIYKPCEKVVATIVRTSKLNMEGHSVVQLYLVDRNNLSKSIPLFNNDVLIEKTESQVFNLTYTLPCNVETGEHFIQALIKYQIKGIEKSYVWRTNTFSIEK